MKRLCSVLLASAAAFIVTACDQTTKTTTVTRYYVEIEDGECPSSMAKDSDRSVEIGDSTFVVYGVVGDGEGLLCRFDDEGLLLAVYEDAANRKATHRWISQSGSGIIGTKHTFEPHNSDVE